MNKNKKSNFIEAPTNEGKESSKSEASEGKKKKGLKIECCEKYLKKGEHKRCKRCPCFDMNATERMHRFMELEIEINSED